MKSVGIDDCMIWTFLFSLFLFLFLFSTFFSSSSLLLQAERVDGTEDIAVEI